MIDQKNPDATDYVPSMPHRSRDMSNRNDGGPENKHTGCKRQFVQLSRAYYCRTALDGDTYDQVMIGYYDTEGGGTTGEFAVRWTEVGGKMTPRLEAFDDSWSALWGFKDLLERMADIDGEDILPNAFCDLLRSLGIEDDTPLEARDNE